MFSKWLYCSYVQNLLLELKSYEENAKAAAVQKPTGLTSLDGSNIGIIPVSVILAPFLN